MASFFSITVFLHHQLKSKFWHKLYTTQAERNRLKEIKQTDNSKETEDFTDSYKLNFCPKIICLHHTHNFPDFCLLMYEREGGNGTTSSARLNLAIS